MDSRGRFGTEKPDTPGILDDAGRVWTVGAPTLEQKAQYVAASRGMDEADVLEQLDDAGWQGNCGQTYSLLAEGKESVLMTPSDLSISSYVYMYEDAEGAEAGFEFLEDESGNAFAEDIPEGTDIGDVLGNTDERA